MPFFDEKKMGRKVFATLVGLSILMSCGLKEIGTEKNDGEGIWIGPGSVIVGNDG